MNEDYAKAAYGAAKGFLKGSVKGAGQQIRHTFDKRNRWRVPLKALGLITTPLALPTYGGRAAVGGWKAGKKGENIDAGIQKGALNRFFIFAQGIKQPAASSYD